MGFGYNVRICGPRAREGFALRPDDGLLSWPISPIPKEHSMNKRKKVAIQKHRAKAKKLEEKRKLGALARRTK
jgi:hypothetical protein